MYIIHGYFYDLLTCLSPVKVVGVKVKTLQVFFVTDQTPCPYPTRSLPAQL
jgi:hypothetical protein